MDLKNNYAAEDALFELARNSGFFMVTLVLEKGSVSIFSDSDSMNSIIEGLTKCVPIPRSCTAKYFPF